MAFGADSDKALLAFKIRFEILCIRITNIYNIWIAYADNML